MGTRDVAEQLEVAIETNIESEAVIAKVRSLRQEMFRNLESPGHEVLLEDVLDRLDLALSGHPTAALAEHDRAAKAEALEEVAAVLSKPRAVWHGDGGVTVLVDESRMTFKPLTEWLRDTAAEYRKAGE